MLITPDIPNQAKRALLRLSREQLRRFGIYGHRYDDGSYGKATDTSEFNTIKDKYIEAGLHHI